MSAWLGWLRRDRRHRWELVSDGETIDQCHARLLDVAKRRRITDSLCRTITGGSGGPSNGQTERTNGQD